MPIDRLRVAECFSAFRTNALRFGRLVFVLFLPQTTNFPVIETFLLILENFVTNSAFETWFYFGGFAISEMFY